MTEIPEHLLKRAKQRRAELSGEGGGDADAGGDSTEASSAAPAPVPASAPAAPAAVTPAEVEEAPPPPPPPHVQAALTRRRIPYWVMPVLAFLPVWAYMYQGTLEPPPDPSDPLTLGAALYEENGCAGCHGGNGGGGVGPAFNGGAIYETWPDWRDHFRWVRLGSSGWPQETYGAQGKPVNGGMPGYETLTDAELILIINYERSVLGGEPPEEDLDEGLTLLTDISAEHLEDGYALLLEEAVAFLDGNEEFEVTEEDLVIEGDGAPDPVE